MPTPRLLWFLTTNRSVKIEKRSHAQFHGPWVYVRLEKKTNQASKSSGPLEDAADVLLKVKGPFVEGLNFFGLLEVELPHERQKLFALGF